MCLGNADSLIGQDCRRFAAGEAMETSPEIGDEVVAVVVTRDSEGHAEFSGSGAKFHIPISSPSFPHLIQADAGFQRPQQDKATFSRAGIFGQDIGQPIHPVVEIHVGAARLVGLDKAPGTGPEKGVAGLVTVFGIGLRLDHDPGTAFPVKLDADQVAGATDWIPLKEISTEEVGGVNLTLLVLRHYPVDSAVAVTARWDDR